jgi:1-acyl-sn-glycerol-3-phosphate acyltransferase
VVTGIIRGVLGTLCKIDSREYREILRGKKIGKNAFTGLPAPMILAVNHTNFLEVPLLVTHIYPRTLRGIIKEEAWDNPIMAFIFDTYNAIPINREGSYLQTFREVREAMEQDVFIGIAPEGKRSGNGVLQKGKGGIVQLALITGAPIVPVVHFGGEKIWENIKHFRRTPFQFRVGRPFRFKYDGRPPKEVREVMLDEVMGQLAALLPENLRGEYADQAEQESRYLEFL